MKGLCCCMLGLLVCIMAHAQDVDSTLLEIKKDLDQVISAKAVLKLELDIDFIKMPTKYAQIAYEKGKTIEYQSENFIIIPKRGLDFSLDELFKYKFMTIDRGSELNEGKTLKILNIIPLDKKADYAIMTMKIDTLARQIVETEITTKDEGTFQLFLRYASAPFPSEVTVAFEIEKMKIPLSFMGKDAEVDKEKLKSNDRKNGKIFLYLDWQAIEVMDEK